MPETPELIECPECNGSGNWTGWSGDDEHTQEGGCYMCDGTGKVSPSRRHVAEWIGTGDGTVAFGVSPYTGLPVTAEVIGFPDPTDTG